MPHDMIFDLEVDVAVRRPPSPENIRTHFVRIAVDGALPVNRAEIQAQQLAALMCYKRGPMVTATRITSAIL